MTAQFTADLSVAPRIAVTSRHHRRRSPYTAYTQTRRYAITRMIVVGLDGKPDYVGMYGYSVRADGLSYGFEHPVNFWNGATVEPIDA